MTALAIIGVVVPVGIFLYLTSRDKILAQAGGMFLLMLVLILSMHYLLSL